MALATNINALLSVTESNFGRSVINAPLPVVALFGSRTCPASRALRPLLNELASVYTGSIRFATINAEQAPLLAGQFGLQITPNPDYHRENLGHYLGNFAIVRYDSNRILCRVDEDGIVHAWYIANA